MCNNDSNERRFVTHTLNIPNEQKRHEVAESFLQWLTNVVSFHDVTRAIALVIHESAPGIYSSCPVFTRIIHSQSMRSNVLFVSHKRDFVRGHLYTLLCDATYTLHKGPKHTSLWEATYTPLTKLATKT